MTGLNPGVPVMHRVLAPVAFTKTTTFSASNTTASEIIATLTGGVEILDITGQVTTAISSNHTAGHVRMNDQTNTPAVTLATGTTLSSAAVGSVVHAAGDETVALTLDNNSQTRVSQNNFTPRKVVKKTGATTTIDYRYTTTNTPATGAIEWTIIYRPTTSDGALS